MLSMRTLFLATCLPALVRWWTLSQVKIKKNLCQTQPASAFLLHTCNIWYSSVQQMLLGPVTANKLLPRINRNRCAYIRARKVHKTRPSFLSRFFFFFFFRSACSIVRNRCSYFMRYSTLASAPSRTAMLMEYKLHCPQGDALKTRVS